MLHSLVDNLELKIWFCQKTSVTWSKMTPNYWMMVERYPNLKEKIGGSIPDCEISSLNLQGGKLPHVLWRWPIDLMSPKIRQKEK